MNAVPVTCWSQARVTTRATESTASPAIRSASGSLGVSTACRGMGSRPTNTSGRPESSSAVAISPMTSVGGGSTSSMARTATDVDAVWASRSNGLTARSPPASQMISKACAAPMSPPMSRSMPDRTPVPSRSAIDLPSVEPTVSPSSTAPRMAPSTTMARGNGSRSVVTSRSQGARLSITSSAMIAPPMPPICGNAPVLTPARTVATSTTTAATSNRFRSTRRVSARCPDPAAERSARGAGPEAGVHARRVDGLPGRDLRLLRLDVPDLVRAGQQHHLAERVDVEVERGAIRQQDALLRQVDAQLERGVRLYGVQQPLVGLGIHDDRQHAVLEGVAPEDVGEAGRQDRPHSPAAERPRRVLARAAGPEVVAGDQHLGALVLGAVEDERRGLPCPLLPLPPPAGQRPRGGPPFPFPFGT